MKEMVYHCNLCGKKLDSVGLNVCTSYSMSGQDLTKHTPPKEAGIHICQTCSRTISKTFREEI